MSEDRKVIEVKEALKDLLEIMEILQQDIQEATNNLFKDANNFWLRTYTRAFFALVEGTTFAIKQVALKAHEYQPCFTEAEISLLKEVSYELNKQGKAKSRFKRLETLSNIKFAFKSVVKAFNLESEIAFDDSGWQSFQKSLQIRHQITHPKNASNLAISDLDDGQGKKIDTVAEASLWYAEQINELHFNMTSAIKKWKNPNSGEEKRL